MDGWVDVAARTAAASGDKPRMPDDLQLQEKVVVDDTPRQDTYIGTAGSSSPHHDME